MQSTAMIIIAKNTPVPLIIINSNGTNIIVTVSAN